MNIISETSPEKSSNNLAQIIGWTIASLSFLSTCFFLVLCRRRRFPRFDMTRFLTNAKLLFHSLRSRSQSYLPQNNHQIEAARQLQLINDLPPRSPVQKPTKNRPSWNFSSDLNHGVLSSPPPVTSLSHRGPQTWGRGQSLSRPISDVFHVYLQSDHHQHQTICLRQLAGVKHTISNPKLPTLR